MYMIIFIIQLFIVTLNLILLNLNIHLIIHSKNLKQLQFLFLKIINMYFHQLSFYYFHYFLKKFHFDNIFKKNELELVFMLLTK